MCRLDPGLDTSTAFLVKLKMVAVMLGMAGLGIKQSSTMVYLENNFSYYILETYGQ
jgi:hypothetical protein